MQSLAIKEADVATDVHPLILKRWSPRSFSDRAISADQLTELFEAASWAASANNEQPWQYVYALRGTPAFDELWECLKPGNQPWAKDAAVLFVALYRKTFLKTGQTNPWAEHDLGMANAQLMLQAAHRDIYGHLMAGFEKGKVTKLLDLTSDQVPVCMGALGYLGNPEDLEEPFRSRELSERSREPVREFVKQL